MRARLGRIGAIGGLALAIFGALGRRVWWTYRASQVHSRQPRPAIVTRQPAERLPHVPQVTPDWVPIVTQALPVRAAALHVEADGTLLPVVWIAAAEQPHISDLPRVLRSVNDRPVVATQWLADAEMRAILVVTFVEPVVSTWAISFDLRHWQPALHAIANAARVCIALSEPPHGLDPYSAYNLPILVDHDEGASIHLPITTPAHLHALLMRLST